MFRVIQEYPREKLGHSGAFLEVFAILGKKSALAKTKAELERTRAELTQTRTELNKALNNVLRLSMELAASHDKARTARQCAAALREASGAKIHFPWEVSNHE